MQTLEAQQRMFYALDDEALERVIREVLEEELSVVDGGILDRFERAAAELFGTRHAVAACNGTAALHLALFALGIGPGDEVLVPTYGYYATALPVCMLGAIPVFCDVREDTLTLDVRDAETVVSPRTKAAIVHQTWGCPADVNELRDFADRYGLKLISDSSHAHGALWAGQPLGRFYDVLCASLGKGKLISGGELGVVATSDDRYRDRMLLYGHVNRVPGALLTSEYRHIANSVGVKYRPHPFAMALALEQIATYGERSRRLVENIQRFELGLARVPGFHPFATPREASRVYWRIPVRIDAAKLGSLQAVLDRLAALDCPVERKGGTLLHRHSAFTEYYGVKTQRSLPVAERLGEETFQVQAFPLYDERFVDPLLERFRAASRT